MDEQAWVRLVEDRSRYYLELDNGGFDRMLKARLARCDWQARSVTYALPTQNWQINERGAIHGGVIAGIFDAAFGAVANLTAGPRGTVTTEMQVSYLRGIELGMELEITVFILKAGRSLIRQRAELRDAAAGKLLATGSGAWMPL